METLIGVVRNIIYESHQNDFKVFNLKKKDHSVIRVTGDFPHIISGTKIEVHGGYKNHSKYGVSFKAEAHSFDYEKNAESICLYIQAIAKWVGPERSWAIAKKFGSELQEIIEKTPEKLTEIEGIGEKVAASIAEAWQLNREMKNIRIFLHSLGLSVTKIKKILTQFGPDTEEILKSNPWILCRHGFGFTTCDHIAYKLEKNMQDPFRFQQFIIYALDQTINSGHLFLYPQQLVDAFNKFNTKTPHPFKESDLTLLEIAPYVRELVKQAYIINDQNRIYELSNFFYESESARLLSKMYKTKDTCKLNNVDVEAYIIRYEKQNKIILSDAQKDALRSFFTEKVMVVTGSPGTGKTTLVKAFVQIMKEKGISFDLLTPTGIAAKKLGNTAECEAYTIHRRLGFKGNEWDYNVSNKYQTQVVICDESSMVDQEVFYRLVSALYSNTKIVMVGDNDQLPSVGPGSVLRELIDSKIFKTIFLDQIFRQEECSEIIKEAKKIRDGDIDFTYFRQDKKADIWHIPEKDDKKIEQLIVKFAQQLKDSEKVKKDNIHFQIITPRNQGPLSVETLNNALQSVLNPQSPDKKEVRLGEYTIRKGDRVIIRKNNYNLNIYNGDIGKVAFITSDLIVIDLEDFFDTSRRVEIPMKLADEIVKLAYTITVHRSQGTEYTLVILPFIKAHGVMLLQRNLLYTALTRAKKKVIILGQTSAIESAIQNDRIQKRNTLFSERIKKWMNGSGISLRNIYSTSSTYQNAKILERLLLLEENT